MTVKKTWKESKMIGTVDPDLVRLHFILSGMTPSTPRPVFDSPSEVTGSVTVAWFVNLGPSAVWTVMGFTNAKHEPS